MTGRSGVSNAEVAARVVAGLLDMSDRRNGLMAGLSAVVRTAVDELDPGHERDSSPTWWVDLPPWARLDSFDRLRRAHDQLAVLEVQAGIVVQDLRGLIRLAPVGSPARPLGHSPAKAHADLVAMHARRAGILADLGKAERVLRPKLSRPTAAGLRGTLRILAVEQATAERDLLRLAGLLATPAPGFANVAS